MTRMCVALFVLVLGLLVLPCAAMAQPAWPGRLDSLLVAMSGTDEFSGNVLVAQNQQIVYQKSFGMADKDHAVPNKHRTKFNVGSIGKLFTSLAVLQLVQRGELDLTDRIGDLFPDFPPDKHPITVHDLLCHASGLGNYMSDPDYADRMSGYRSIDSVLPLIAGESLAFEIGTRFGYSNSGYVLLGAIIERTAGIPYGDYLRQHILDPAGMGETGHFFREDIVADRAAGYTVDADGELVSNVFVEPPAFSDGGLLSTTEDLLRFDRALQGGLFLDTEHMALWRAPQPNGFAYGPASMPAERTLCGKPMYGGMGGAPGISALFNHIEEDDYLFVVLSNYDRVALTLLPELEKTVYGLQD